MKPYHPQTSVQLSVRSYRLWPTAVLSREQAVTEDYSGAGPCRSFRWLVQACYNATRPQMLVPLQHPLKNVWSYFNRLFSEFRHRSRIFLWPHRPHLLHSTTPLSRWVGCRTTGNFEAFTTKRRKHSTSFWGFLVLFGVRLGYSGACPSPFQGPPCP